MFLIIIFVTLTVIFSQKDITTGRISSWIIYNCTSGQEALNKLNTEQIEMVFPYIDPDFGNVNLWIILLILNG